MAFIILKNVSICGLVMSCLKNNILLYCYRVICALKCLYHQISSWPLCDGLRKVSKELNNFFVLHIHNATLSAFKDCDCELRTTMKFVQ